MRQGFAITLQRCTSARSYDDFRFLAADYGRRAIDGRLPAGAACATALLVPLGGMAGDLPRDELRLVLPCYICPFCTRTARLPVRCAPDMAVVACKVISLELAVPLYREAVPNMIFDLSLDFIRDGVQGRSKYGRGMPQDA